MPLIVGPLPTVISPKPTEQPQPQTNIEQQASRSFWTAQGYPQFAGRYKAVDLQGRRIASVTETPEGLNIRFASNQPSRAALLKHDSLSMIEPQYQTAYDLKPSPPAKAGYYYDPTGQFYKSVGYNLFEATLALKGEPKTLTYYTTHHDRASEVFYEGIGHPEYAGVYAPFEIPAGYQIKSIAETTVPKLETTGNMSRVVQEKQLSVTFEPTAETLSRIGKQQVPTKQVYVAPRPTRWSELQDFGQDIMNLKANVGTSSLTEIIEQYATGLYSKDVVTSTMQKTGFLPSQASNLMKVAGAVSTVESYINPNVPSLLELGSKSPEFIVGRLTGEAMLIAGTTELFSWVTRGTVSPLRGPVENWLMKSYKEQLEAGVKIPSWTWKQSLVMKLTGVKPYLPYGEVSIPIMETVSKTGVISGVPSGLPFTDIGWEMSIAPRMGGVMITKEAVETSPKALELFFGIGQELIPFGKIKGEGEQLGFQKETAKAGPMEKGLPSSMLDESYYPKVGSLDITVQEVNVRGVTAWSKWPTTRSLIEQQALLPFVTQTQVTRLGITPFIPDLDLGMESASRFLGSAFMLGLSVALVPKTSQQPKTTEFLGASFMLGTALLSKTTQQPKQVERLKAFQGSFQLPSLKNILEVYSETRTEQEQVPALMSGLAFMQETKQVQSLAQIQKQIQGTTQRTTQVKQPKFDFPKDFTMPKMQMPKPGRKRKGGQGLYLWEFEILEPSKVLKKLMK